MGNPFDGKAASVTLSAVLQAQSIAGKVDSSIKS